MENKTNRIFNNTNSQSLVNKLIAEKFCKRYGKNNPVFKDTEFKMESGHIYGLVAPNGSGKTTLMKCISGVSNFTGKIEYNGVPVGSHFNGRIVHSVSTPFFTDTAMKVIEYLHSVAILKNLKFKEVLEKFRRSRVSHLENHVCRNLSTGQKKLFQLFIDFLSEPEVILLDEPLNGLDQQERLLVTSNFSLLAKQGRMIVISTHVFSDIENLTDKVFIVKDGLRFCEGKKISEVYNEIFPFENKETVNF